MSLWTTVLFDELLVCVSVVVVVIVVAFSLEIQKSDKLLKTFLNIFALRNNTTRHIY
jgi:hypothetical protein